MSKITVSFNVDSVPSVPMSIIESYLKEYASKMSNAPELPDFRSRGGYINQGTFWHVSRSYWGNEYRVPEKVMQFNFTTGEWES